MKKNKLKNLVRNIINEQPGTAWCATCNSIHGPTYCGGSGKPCNPNFDKDNLSCSACRNLFASTGTMQPSLVNNHCKQPGQPCHGQITRTLSKGEAWDTSNSNMQAKMGGGKGRGRGRNVVKLRESDLKSVVNRVLNEREMEEASNPVCPNPVSCQTGFAQAPANHPTDPCECVRASSLQRRRPTKGKGKKQHSFAREMREEKKRIGSDCNGARGNDGCPEGSFCSGMPMRRPGKCQSGGMVSHDGGKGKGGKRRNDRLKYSKEASKYIKLKESDLKKVITRTMNESMLLNERKYCWWRTGSPKSEGDLCGRSENHDIPKSQCQSRARCLSKNGTSVRPPDGVTIITGDKTKTSKTTRGKKTTGLKSRLKHSKEASKHIMKLKETDLINIIKRTINESSLLVEAEECGSADKNRQCSDSTNGRGTCKGNAGECYIPHELRHDQHVVGGDCGPGETMGARGCVCTNPKLCGEKIDRMPQSVTAGGSWSNLTSEIKNLITNNPELDMDPRDILRIMQSEVRNLQDDPSDDPVGKKRCGGINDFGGDKWCFTPDHKGWKLTIWFSDMTLKENIELVGKSKSGVNIYEFDYINKEYGNGRYRGVMAQEVPSASKVGPGGKLMVDYSKLDVDFERLN